MTYRSYSLTDVIRSVISFVFSLVIIGLIIRFVLLLFGAEREGFPRFIYDSTDPLVAPFDSWFQSADLAGDSILEYESLFAIIVYLILMYLIFEALAFIDYNASGYRVVRDSTGETVVVKK